MNKEKNKNQNNDVNFINPEDKGLFLKSLNRKGFILEYKTKKVLELLGIKSRLHYCPDIKKLDRNSRIELDVYFKHKNYEGVVECKRTEFDWIFAKEFASKGTMYLFEYSPQKMMRVHKIPDSNVNSVDSEIAIMFDSDRRLTKSNNKDPRMSYEDIHKAVRQVLKGAEAILYNYSYLNKVDIKNNEYIVPIIVTNANLFLMTFSYEDINNNGDLGTYKEPEQVPYLAYNFPEIITWSKEPEIIQSTDAKSGNMKSVFIVNINKIKEFIDFLESVIEV